MTTTECPFEATFDMIRGKWTYCILDQIARHTRGFNEVLRANPGLTPKVLAGRLRDLEKDGIVARRVIPTNPPSSEYSLAPLGTELLPLIREVEGWGRRYLGRARAAA